MSPMMRISWLCVKIATVAALMSNEEMLQQTSATYCFQYGHKDSGELRIVPGSALDLVQGRLIDVSSAYEGLRFFGGHLLNNTCIRTDTETDGTEESEKNAQKPAVVTPVFYSALCYIFEKGNGQLCRDRSDSLCGFLEREETAKDRLKLLAKIIAQPERLKADTPGFTNLQAIMAERTALPADPRDSSYLLRGEALMSVFLCKYLESVDEFQTVMKYVYRYARKSRTVDRFFAREAQFDADTVSRCRVAIEHARCHAPPSIESLPTAYVTAGMLPNHPVNVDEKLEVNTQYAVFCLLSSLLYSSAKDAFDPERLAKLPAELKAFFELHSNTRSVSKDTWRAWQAVVRKSHEYKPLPENQLTPAIRAMAGVAQMLADVLHVPFNVAMPLEKCKSIKKDAKEISAVLLAAFRCCIEKLRSAATARCTLNNSCCFTDDPGASVCIYINLEGVKNAQFILTTDYVPSNRSASVEQHVEKDPILWYSEPYKSELQAKTPRSYSWETPREYICWLADHTVEIGLDRRYKDLICKGNTPFEIIANMRFGRHPFYTISSFLKALSAFALENPNSTCPALFTSMMQHYAREFFMVNVFIIPLIFATPDRVSALWDCIPPTAVPAWQCALRMVSSASGRQAILTAYKQRTEGWNDRTARIAAHMLGISSDELSAEDAKAARRFKALVNEQSLLLMLNTGNYDQFLDYLEDVDLSEVLEAWLSGERMSTGRLYIAKPSMKKEFPEIEKAIARRSEATPSVMKWNMLSKRQQCALMYFGLTMQQPLLCIDPRILDYVEPVPEMYSLVEKFFLINPGVHLRTAMQLKKETLSLSILISGALNYNDKMADSAIEKHFHSLKAIRRSAEIELENIFPINDLENKHMKVCMKESLRADMKMLYGSDELECKKVDATLMGASAGESAICKGDAPVTASACTLVRPVNSSTNSSDTDSSSIISSDTDSITICPCNELAGNN